MPTLEEKKARLLYEIIDPDNEAISKEFLQDIPTLKSLITDFGTEFKAKYLFFLKILPSEISLLFENGVFSEKDLQDLFTLSDYNSSKMLEILRNINFESRQSLIAKLKEASLAFTDLEDKIDVKYGMLNGMLIQDISVQAKSKANARDIFDKLTEMLEDTNSSLDLFLQYSDSVARGRIDDYQIFLQDLWKIYQEFIFSSQPISDQKEFSQIVKLAYLLSINKLSQEKWSKEIQRLKERILASIFLYKEGPAICLILNQLPEYFIKGILLDIINTGKVKKVELRNRAILCKKEIEKALQHEQYLNLTRCIKNYNLSYNIK